MTTGSENWDDNRKENFTQNENELDSLQSLASEKLLADTSPTPILNKMEKQTLEQQELLKRIGHTESVVMEEPFTRSLSPERRQRLEGLLRTTAKRMEKAAEGVGSGKDLASKAEDKSVSARKDGEKSESGKDGADKALKTPQDIERAAKQLSEIGNKFLSGSTEDESIKQWSEEINKLAKSNDLETLKKVFQKVIDVNSGFSPLLNIVERGKTEDGAARIFFFPSAIRSGLGTLNHRSIAAIIDDKGVFTHASRNDWNMSKESSYTSRQ